MLLDTQIWGGFILVWFGLLCFFNILPCSRIICLSPFLSLLSSFQPVGQ